MFFKLCTLIYWVVPGFYLFLIINTRHFTKCSFELEENNRNMKLWFCPTFSYQWGLPMYTACTNALYACWIFTSKMAPRGSICGMYTCNSVEKLGFSRAILWKNNATLAHRENVFELHKGVSILEVVIATLKQYFTVEFFSSQSLIYSLWYTSMNVCRKYSQSNKLFMEEKL